MNGIRPWALAILALAACGEGESDPEAGAAEAGSSPPVPECGAVRLAAGSASPFERVPVDGLPVGFSPTAAEVTAADVDAALLAPVVITPEGTARLRVPVHPSFRIDGGEVRVRIYDGANSCEEVAFTITPLPRAPGAMAESVRELRAAFDEILAPVLHREPPRHSSSACTKPKASSRPKVSGGVSDRDGWRYGGHETEPFWSAPAAIEHCYPLIW